MKTDIINNKPNNVSSVLTHYDQACKELQACIDIGEAKHWANKADALAAWAKINQDSKATRKAKVLKLLAYRVAGQLAGELRPPGTRPGLTSLLREHGFTETESGAARALARTTQHTFDKLVSKDNPPAPNTAANFLLRGTASENYTIISRGALLAGSSGGLTGALSCLRRLQQHIPLLRSLAVDETNKVRNSIVELQSILDAMEQQLPKDKGSRASA